MHALVHLVLTLAPLAAFSALSPVVFLNANTAVAREGARGGWHFVAGNAAVLTVLGVAFVGMLGTSASELATRQIASAVVDKVLALVLIGYGAYLGWTHRLRSRSDAGWRPTDDQDRQGSRGMFGWGAIGMATNFTSLPLFASCSQRIGAADIGWLLRVPLLVLLVGCTLTPAWLPVLLHRARPGRADVSSSTRARIARWSSMASIVACFLGGGVLLWVGH